VKKPVLVMTVAVALAAGAVLGSFGRDIYDSVADVATAAPAQQSSFEAQSIIREAEFHAMGEGGYSVYIWRNFSPGMDVGMVTFYGYGVIPTATYVCVRNIGWDCWRW